jgi:putative molybdopterin biosynthesis protein
VSQRNVFLDDIPLAEAYTRLETALRQAGRWEPLPGEPLALADALGRTTADPIWAKLSSPHYHAAAMDGYAVRAHDTRQATETRPVQLARGVQAHPVNTGDPLPPGTDAVIMIEHVHDSAGQIDIRAAVAPWQHVRMMGEDMVATELVLPANHTLRPVDLGAIAGCGHATVSVRRRPRVVILPTGSELVAVGQHPAPGQVIEYNSLVMRAQVIDAGGQVEVAAITPDDPQALRQALLQTLQGAIQQQPDLILVLSGSSAGSRDFAAAAIADLGELLVHGIAVRPGHPVILGMLAGVPIIGVPGYPVSAALTGELFVLPLLAHWSGHGWPGHSEAGHSEAGHKEGGQVGMAMAPERPRLTAILTRKLASSIGDDDFVRVTLAQVGERLLATPISRGAGAITSLVRADGLAHVPRFSEGVDLGQPVEVMLYRSPEVIRRTVFAMGSHDPMLDLLAQHLALRFPEYRLASANVGSMGGLVALRRQESHLAGIHLLDEETGDYNIWALHKHLPAVPLSLITFAHREQGLIVPKDNPLQVASLDDLPRLRYINRQRGAGTRLLLDYELRRRRIDPAHLTGYDLEEYTHLGVAAAVASGIADAGLGVRSAALALDLDFVPVGWERFDLVIPAAHAEHPGVVRLVEVLRSEAFRAALGAQPGYDTHATGALQFVQRP